MLIVVRTVDDDVVERLFGVYAESMGEDAVDPWGECDECGVLYRLATGGDVNSA